MKMEWPMFSEHIIHHVEQHRKEKKDADEQSKQLTSKLAQMQLGGIHQVQEG
uniref:Uncharacterized protein n=1 Tax=Anguilla anguilla TaxID=7936 RepID=A0A0E9T3N0_ANGAN